MGTWTGFQRLEVTEGKGDVRVNSYVLYGKVNDALFFIKAGARQDQTGVSLILSSHCGCDASVTWTPQSLV